MLVVGHRGAAGAKPENSLAGIRHALRLGVAVIEVDVRRTADGALVLFHDALLDRTTDGSGYLEETTLADLAKLRLANGEAIPRLRQAADLLRGGSTRLWIDLVSPDVEDLAVAEVLPVLGAERLLIGSFHHRSLARLAATQPGLETIAAFEGAPLDAVRLVEGTGCSAVALGFESIDAGVVNALHGAGYRVFGWTLNDPREVERARRLGLDGVITDHPERILSPRAEPFA